MQGEQQFVFVVEQEWTDMFHNAYGFFEFVQRQTIIQYQHEVLGGQIVDGAERMEQLFLDFIHLGHIRTEGFKTMFEAGEFFPTETQYVFGIVAQIHIGSYAVIKNSYNLTGGFGNFALKQSCCKPKIPKRRFFGGGGQNEEVVFAQSFGQQHQFLFGGGVNLRFGSLNGYLSHRSFKIFYFLHLFLKRLGYLSYVPTGSYGRSQYAAQTLYGQFVFFLIMIDFVA